MKINSININNYLGLRDLRVQDPAKVLLLAGFNGAGKSSAAEAIRHALESKFSRVPYKKDLWSFLNEGATAGHVLINTTLGEFGVTLPAGDVAGDHAALSPFLSYCLNPGSFAALPAQERRGMLFKLMGVKANGETIGTRLIDKGAELLLVNQIRPYLSGGFDAGNKQALEFARNAKADWRAVTGETYGEKKAETWKIERPAGYEDEADLDGIAEALSAADTEVSRLSIESGVLKARKSQAENFLRESAGRDEKLEDLRGKAGKFAAIQDSVNKADDERKNVQRVIDGITASIEAAEQAPLACPHCAGMVEYTVAGSVPRLTRYEGETIDPKELSDAQATLLIQQTKLSQLNADIGRLNADLAAADRSAVELAALESTEVKVVNLDDIAEELAKHDQALIEANLKRDQLRESERHARDQSRILSEIDKKNADAMRSHNEVKAWDLIADALSPNGIVAELLAEAIEPFNQTMFTLCEDAGWFNVQVTHDMEIDINGRPYALASEGEKWRADAIMATAIAQNSGVEMIMLDRFDVLDMRGRGQLIEWLGKVALDSVIIMGTMKQAPAGLPAFITPIWLSGE